MSALPDGLNAAVAFGVDCSACALAAPGAVEYLRALLAQGAPLQLFVESAALHAPAVREAVAAAFSAGGAADLLLPTDAAETQPCELDAALTDALAAWAEASQDAPLGARLGHMDRHGLQHHEDLQRVLLEGGLRYVSSEYPTKDPETGSSSFADKNAAMIIKHSQPRRYASRLVEVPAPGYSDQRFLVQQARPLAQWLEHVKACVDFAYDLGGLMYAPNLHLDVLHAQDPQAQTLPTLMQYAASKRLGKVGFITHRQAAEALGA
jgi:hypothetical protein